MGKSIIFMSVAIIILLIISGLYMSRANNAEKKIIDAQLLSKNTKSLLKNLNIRCAARDSDFAKVNICLNKALYANDFKEEDFEIFNSKTNKTGFLIIQNNGVKIYNGSKFTLLKNGAEIYAGCHIKGDIEPEYTCRFPIEKECLDGDVLEINYEDSRVYIKNC